MPTAARRRSGKSLIELVVVIAILGVIMPVAGRMIHTLLRAEQDGRKSLVADTSLSRFARQFRQDVHAARDATLLEGDEPTTGVRLSGDAEDIVYRLEGDRILRRAERSMSGQTKTVASDVFHVGSRNGRFEMTEEPRLVAYEQERFLPAGSDHSAQGGPGGVRIEAVLGRNQRFGR